MSYKPRHARPAIETDALAIWHQARPATAMTLLADHGYSEKARREFLIRNGVCRESAETFSSPSYLITED